MQSSWEASSRTAGQEIFHFLWIVQVHCFIQNSLPMDHTLNQLNAVQIIPSQSFYIHPDALFCT
jgi:hypothetical protein